MTQIITKEFYEYLNRQYQKYVEIEEYFFKRKRSLTEAIAELNIDNDTIVKFYADTLHYCEQRNLCWNTMDLVKDNIGCSLSELMQKLHHEIYIIPPKDKMHGYTAPEYPSERMKNIICGIPDLTAHLAEYYQCLNEETFFDDDFFCFFNTVKYEEASAFGKGFLKEQYIADIHTCVLWIIGCSKKIKYLSSKPADEIIDGMTADEQIKALRTRYAYYLKMYHSICQKNGFLANSRNLFSVYENSEKECSDEKILTHEFYDFMNKRMHDYDALDSAMSDGTIVTDTQTKIFYRSESGVCHAVITLLVNPNIGKSLTEIINDLKRREAECADPTDKNRDLKKFINLHHYVRYLEAYLTEFYQSEYDDETDDYFIYKHFACSSQQFPQAVFKGFEELQASSNIQWCITNILGCKKMLSFMKKGHYPVNSDKKLIEEHEKMLSSFRHQYEDAKERSGRKLSLNI